MSLTSSIKAWLASPPVLRFFFAIGRRVAPLASIRGTRMVLRGVDVLEVLRGTERFGVSANYAARMAATTGPFFLGMEDTPQYRRERAFADAAVLSDDLPRIEEIAGSCAREALAVATRTGRLDLVGGYSRHVPLVLVQRWFGVVGPDEATLARWLRTIFWDLFLNFSPGDPAVTAAAAESSREMNAYLDQLIAQRRAELAGGGVPVTVLDRMIILALGEFRDLPADAIRRNIAGLVVGAVDTISKAFIYALQELLDRRVPLADAIRAARSGAPDRVTGYALEALRFRPHNPLLIRYALSNTTLAAGTRRAKSLASGDRLFAWSLSASFDAELFPSPRRFDPSRPRESYLHFGGGMHRCFGATLATSVVSILLATYLDVGPYLTAEREQDDGPFPDRWIVAIPKPGNS